MKTMLFALLCALPLFWKCENAPSKVTPQPDETIVPGGEQAAAEDTLRLATYNVGVFSKSGTNTTNMVAAMAKELGISALSLNELDSCNTRNNVFQIKRFAEAMGGWDYTFAQALNYKGGGYGIGIASDPSLQIQKRMRLKLERGDGSEQRALAVCEFRDFVFCSTHLDHTSKKAQLSQATTINNWVKSTYGNTDKPVILCGDFNALPDSETITYMKKEWTILSPIEPTYPAKAPSKCIDYIMVYRNASSRVEVQAAEVPTEFKSGDVTIASDHLPVYVDVVIKDASR
ncbi:MAG: endonuclease/exonuclease/phosphatase family protein [Bacteroidales bacterium]|nr:endonuclease/exonuclease/phosphatase family protein [Bacteroidales bacterium]